MKKVGILTLFGEYNFGNRLQNYAVQEILKDNGLEVETIKYLLKSNENLPIKTKIEENRLAKFREFNKKIKFADKIIYMDGEAPIEYREKYDYIVLGSDQIWNYSYKTFSTKAFASFAKENRKFSFAASFGMDWMPEEDSDLYRKCKKCLNELKAISVREFSGKEIVEKITGRDDIEVLVDPTMLLSEKKWSSLVKKPDNLKVKKYIVKSFLGEVSKKTWKTIENIARQNNCEIIDISDKESLFYNIGPEEFLYLVKNAFLVLTDSFHACVFSILFSTPFIVFEREDNVKSMYSRIETLVKKFEMEYRVFGGEITDKVFYADNQKIQLILEDERRKADDFLKKALF